MRNNNVQDGPNGKLAPKLAIRGLTYSSTTPTEPPILLVIGREKCGKSTSVTTLFGWPNPDSVPVVLAADPSGPDSCAKLGYRVPTLKIKDMPGLRYKDKVKAAVSALEDGFAHGPRPGSVVVDCVSTLVERLLSDEQQESKNPDPRAAYYPCELELRSLWNRLQDLSVPVIYLAWLREGGIYETRTPTGQKSKRLVLGGANIMGDKMRALVAGKAHMILLLEKVNVGRGAQGADEQGYIRQFRTATYDNIECGGRYYLPDPCPAHLGWVLSAIMNGPAFFQSIAGAVPDEARAPRTGEQRVSLETKGEKAARIGLAAEHRQR